MASQDEIEVLVKDEPIDYYSNGEEVTIKKELIEEEDEHNFDSSADFDVDMAASPSLKKEKISQSTPPPLITDKTIPYNLKVRREQTLYECKTCFIQKTHLSILMKHINDDHPDLAFRKSDGVLFKCEPCNKIFPQHGSFAKHLRGHLHIPKKRNKCLLCGLTFDYNYLLKRHTVSVHLNMSPHKCDLCDKFFNQKSHLNRHMVTHNKKHIFKCPQCDDSFRNNFLLTCHVNKRHTDNKKSFQCHLCRKNYAFDYHLDTHLKFHERYKDNQCPKCGKAFASKLVFMKHMKKCYGEIETGMHICKICKKYRKNKEEIAMHLESDHAFVNKDEINSYIDYRPKLLNGKTPRKRIRKAGNSTKNVENKKLKSDKINVDNVLYESIVNITSCLNTKSINNNMKDEDDIKIDIAYDSSDSDDIPLKSIASNRKLLRKCQLNSDEEHVEVVPEIMPDIILGTDEYESAEKKVPCPHCDMKFLRDTHMKSHIKSMHEAKIFRCTDCDAALLTKRNLVRHMRKHKDDKTIKCAYCPRTFSYESTMKQHMMEHRNNKLIECHICFFSFEGLEAYRLHMETTHSSGELFQCSYCPKMFLKNDVLRRHESRVHKMYKHVQKLGLEECSIKS